METIDKIQVIINTVCDYYKIRYSDIHRKCRLREIIQCRQIAMFFAMKYAEKGMSLKNIGWQIGQKNHATVLHANKTVNNLYDTNKVFRAQINELNLLISEKFTTLVTDTEARRKKINDILEGKLKPDLSSHEDIYLYAKLLTEQQFKEFWNQVKNLIIVSEFVV